MRLILKFTLLIICLQCCGQSNNNKSTKINVAVWDTYVTKKDGSTMHFDILVNANVKDTAIIYAYGREYLKSKGQAEQPLTAQESKFCHTEPIKAAWEQTIQKTGYYIIEMENCK